MASKISSTTGFVSVQCARSFNQLSGDEKRYAYHLMRGAWLGSRATFSQVSANSRQLFDLIRGLLTHAGSAAALRRTMEAAAAPDHADDVDDLLRYFAAVVSNAGNFVSFGDAKFVPNVPFERARALLDGGGGGSAAAGVWDALRADVYAEPPAPKLGLGFPGDGGETGYYAGGVQTAAEAKRVQELLDRHQVSAINTVLARSEKKQDVADDGVVRYELHVASALGWAEDRAVLRDDSAKPAIEVRCVPQLFAADMSLLVRHLRAARQFAACDAERTMLDQYVAHFESGDIEQHKESQRTWVRILGPAVEQNIGFVETYRDPLGVRAEFEGLVACNDKAKSRLYGELVARAGSGIIAALPWPAAYERPNFVSPDYTSLEVIGMAGSGIPIGINIPNYDDVREQVGFKNVTLANIIRAREAVTKYTDYLESASDADLLKQNAALTMDVEVALHELLGHGSGRLFTEEHAAALPVDPTTGEPARTFYAAGETWSSVFGAISGPAEECRAEAVALYLCDHAEVANVFDYEGRVDELVRCVFSSMMISALKGMAYHDGNKWGQPHCQARFALLRVLVDAGAVEVRPAKSPETAGNEFGSEFRLHFADDFHARGKPAVGQFLRDLTVFKALRDVDRLNKLFGGMSAIDTDFYRAVRADVVARKEPRPLYIQPDVRWNGGDPVLTEYSATVDGSLDAFLAHFDESELH